MFMESLVNDDFVEEIWEKKTYKLKQKLFVQIWFIGKKNKIEWLQIEKIQAHFESKGANMVTSLDFMNGFGSVEGHTY